MPALDAQSKIIFYLFGFEEVQNYLLVQRPSWPQRVGAKFNYEPQREHRLAEWTGTFTSPSSWADGNYGPKSPPATYSL